jgi:hypothetical protein
VIQVESVVDTLEAAVTFCGASPFQITQKPWLNELLIRKVGLKKFTPLPKPLCKLVISEQRQQSSSAGYPHRFETELIGF